MICLGSLLAVKTRAKFSTKHLALAGMFSLALLMSFSRGPWVAAAAMVLIYAYLGRNSLASLAPLLVGAAIVVGVLSMTSAGQQILDFLPFIGSARDDTIELSSAIAHQWPRCFLADAVFRVVDL